jgi:hypothetical protein
MPSFPNYRLGPLDNPGVPCTATVSAGEPIAPIQGKALWVYPNPANTSITIEYQAIEGQNPALLLFNSLGQMLRSVSLPKGQGSVQVSVAELPEGVYWYVIPGVSKASGMLVIKR